MFLAEVLENIHRCLCPEDNKGEDRALYRRAISAFFFIVFEAWMSRQKSNPPTGFAESDFIRYVERKAVEVSASGEDVAKDKLEALHGLYTYRTLADHFYDFGNGYVNVTLYYDVRGAGQRSYKPLGREECERAYNFAKSLLNFLSTH